nr:hypothetical protein Itr_chr03CG14500 [Ipomoea trifida]
MSRSRWSCSFYISRETADHLPVSAAKRTSPETNVSSLSMPENVSSPSENSEPASPCSALNSSTTLSAISTRLLSEQRSVLGDVSNNTGLPCIIPSYEEREKKV